MTASRLNLDLHGTANRTPDHSTLRRPGSRAHVGPRSRRCLLGLNTGGGSAGVPTRSTAPDPDDREHGRVDRREPGVRCVREGRYWRLSLGRRSTSVAHNVGMLHLAVLIANPGQEVTAIDLAAGVAALGAARATSGPAARQEVLDHVAVREYRGRVARLRVEIDALEARGESVRAAGKRTEQEWIMAELARAAGFGGRARQFTDSSERARVAVGKAIRRSIARIAEADPLIGEHLRTTVHTGLRCCYRPVGALPAAA